MCSYTFIVKECLICFRFYYLGFLIMNFWPIFDILIFWDIYLNYYAKSVYPFMSNNCHIFYTSFTVIIDFLTKYPSLPCHSIF